MEVGDVGIFLGNWGLRAKKGANTAVFDRQNMGNPCQIIVLSEATPTVKASLEQPPTHIADRSCGHTGQAPTGNAQQRDHYQNWVMLGTDHDKGDILMAARTNNCEEVEINYANHWVDDVVKKPQQITQIPVCTFFWRHNIGHLGSEVVLCGVHGTRDIMAQRCTATVYKTWWDNLAKVIHVHEGKFLGGDFNMSLTQVVPEQTNGASTSTPALGILGCTKVRTRQKVDWALISWQCSTLEAVWHAKCHGILRTSETFLEQRLVLPKDHSCGKKETAVGPQLRQDLRMDLSCTPTVGI